MNYAARRQTPNPLNLKYFYIIKIGENNKNILREVIASRMTITRENTDKAIKVNLYKL